MACPSQNYSGLDSGPISWTNWSGRFSGTASRYFEPDTLADLVNVVQAASALGHMVHVVGSGWAFEDLAFSPDWMISLVRLNKPLDGVIGGALNAQWAASQAAGIDLLFHVEAGAKVVDVNDALDARGLAMVTLGGANGQAIAGAISTSTHGCDMEIPPLADAVMAMHLVTVDGRELWIERRSDPITDDVALALALSCPDTEIVRDDDLFNALLVGFGRFGVIYSYVLRVRPAFTLAEWTTKVSRAAFTGALRAGIGGGTFLAPLLAMLPPPPAALGALNPATPHSLEVVFDTNNLGQCYVKRRWFSNDTSQLHIVNADNPLCAIGAAGVLAAGLVVLGQFVPIPFYGVAVSAEMTALSATLAANPAMTAGEMLAQLLAGFWGLGLGWAIPQVTGVEFGQQYQDSTTDGRRGPSHLIMTGFRGPNLQTCYRADSIEPIFDAHGAGYIDFLDAELDAAANVQQAGYFSLRWSAASRATMSMHNVPSAHAVAIEITSLRNLPANAAWMSATEATAIAHGGRPHWGQINTQDATGVAGLYGANLVAWRSALGALVGGSNVFSNAFSARRGLEPNAGATAVTTGLRAGDLAGAAAMPAIGLLLATPAVFNPPQPPDPRPKRPPRPVRPPRPFGG